MESSLNDIPEYEVDADNFMDRDGVMDADDAVGMYAGAGPHDLDDGGPSFGDSGNAALAGARRARARKNSRIMVHAQKYANRRLQTGYKSLILVQAEAPQVELRVQSLWPNDLVNSWIKETNVQQVQSMAQSDPVKR